ncbi:MAG: DUF885 domain-containing protein, partial [Acidobacteriota bacterium]|nr:DUF885 domain-containing protein [Acidobacteriota bacterium]
MKLTPLLFATLLVLAFTTQMTNAQNNQSPASLRQMAQDYYHWRDQNYPVDSSNEGLHTWDNRLTDYSLVSIMSRRQHVKDLLARVQAIKADAWQKDDRIDWLLFRAELERAAFFDRVLNFEQTNPQVYVGECADAIFSLLKKEYDAPRTRALAATSRLKQMPAMLEEGKKNLT